MRILIVEDNHRLARNIQAYLQNEYRYTVDAVFDGDEGMKKALEGKYDCVILDIKLPGFDGFQICEMIRKQHLATPVLMLTALSDKRHTVKGLDSGADDYLKKPFALEELGARIRAMMRRNTPTVESVLTAGSVVLDPNTHVVKKKKRTIALAPKEYAILEFLLRNKGRAQGRETIIEHVWGEREDVLFSQTLDVHIAYLRKKVDHDLIQTIPGKGYMVPSL